jgi:transglutaminase-like putative cysteine protease
MTTEYHIEYHTHNVYETDVSEAIFDFLVAPCKDATQVVTQLNFRNSVGGETFHRNNPFGFEVACVRTTKPFREFEFRMKATVEKYQQDPYTHGHLSVEDEQQILAAHDFYIDHHLYLEYSKFTTITEDYSDHILYRQPDQFTYNFLTQLNHYVHNMLEFDPEPTNVHTTVCEAIEIGKGVCQDFTHLFVAFARKNRIPCRYVSGYLNQGGSLIGSAAMHAWVEAFVPGNGWHGFDPTNNLLVDMNYIKTAHGVDYSDCSPIKGVLKTSGENKTSYNVRVRSKFDQDAEAAQ